MYILCIFSSTVFESACDVSERRNIIIVNLMIWINEKSTKVAYLFFNYTKCDKLKIDYWPITKTWLWCVENIFVLKRGVFGWASPPPISYISAPGLMFEHENVDPLTDYVVIAAQPVCCKVRLWYTYRWHGRVRLISGRFLAICAVMSVAKCLTARNRGCQARGTRSSQ